MSIFGQAANSIRKTLIQIRTDGSDLEDTLDAFVDALEEVAEAFDELDSRVRVLASDK